MPQISPSSANSLQRISEVPSTYSLGESGDVEERNIGKQHHEPGSCGEACVEKWALHEAARKGDADAFQKLLLKFENTDSRSLWEVDCQGRTILHSICQNDNECDLTMVELLLKWRIEVPADYIDAVDAEGNSALHYAATNYRPGVVSFLMQHGSNPSLADGDGSLPLHLAAHAYSSSKEALETVEMLLSKENDKNVKTKSGVNALGVCRSPQIVEFLIQQGVDYKDVVDAEGYTPLHNAVFYASDDDEEDLSCIGRLLELLDSEYVNAKLQGDTDGRTPWQLCIFMPKTLGLFLSSPKVDIFMTENDNCTILHIACDYGWSDDIKVTLETILQCKRLLSSSDEKTKLLNIRNKKDKTALDMSIDSDSVPMSEFILSQYPDPQSAITVDLMTQIYQKVPEIMLPMIKVSRHGSSDGESFQAELWPITGCHLGEELIKDEEGRLAPLECETDFLSFILDSKDVKIQEQSNVLGHPIVEMFIFAKWDKVKWLFWLYFIIEISLIILYLVFVSDVYLGSCPYTNNTDLGSSNSKMRQKCIVSTSQQIFGYTIVICFLINLIGRTVIVLHTFGFYFKKMFSLKFVLQISFTAGSISTILFACISGPSYWQYWVSAISIVVAAMLSLSHIREIPTLGIYADVFYDVLGRLMLLTLAFSPLIIGFTISISLVLPKNAPFATPLLGLVKVLVMMTGELDFDDVFHKDDYKTPFWSFGLGIYVLFTILVAIVMFNLLLGFTISDIKELQDTSETQLLITTLEQTVMLERLIFSTQVQKVVPRRWLERVLLTECLSIQLDKLPMRVRTKIRDLVKSKEINKEK